MDLLPSKDIGDTNEHLVGVKHAEGVMNHAGKLADSLSLFRCNQIHVYNFICSINNSFRLYIVGRDHILVHLKSVYCRVTFSAAQGLALVEGGGRVTNDPRVPPFAFLSRVAQHGFEQKTGCTWMRIRQQGTKCTNRAQWMAQIYQATRTPHNVTVSKCTD